MKLTPLDVKQQQFQSAFRGVDKKEVEGFLEQVADEMENLIHQNNELKETIAKLESSLKDHQERERSLRETLMTAQRMSEDMKELAAKEAESLVRRAEVEAERIVYDAERSRQKLVEELHELKRYKVQFESTLRSQIQVHMNLLDALKEEMGQEPEDLKEKLTFLKRPVETETEAGEKEKQRKEA